MLIEVGAVTVSGAAPAGPAATAARSATAANTQRTLRISPPSTKPPARHGRSWQPGGSAESYSPEIGISRPGQRFAPDSGRRLQTLVDAVTLTGSPAGCKTIATARIRPCIRLAIARARSWRAAIVLRPAFLVSAGSSRPTRAPRP